MESNSIASPLLFLLFGVNVVLTAGPQETPGSITADKLKKLPGHNKMVWI